MIKLKHLKVGECPVCGCTTVIEEGIEVNVHNREIREHANGHRWEHRQFLCGLKVAWVPNFRAAHVHSVCDSDPDVKDLQTKMTKLRDTWEQARLTYGAENAKCMQEQERIKHRIAKVINHE